jgi:hypothetical protein
VFAKPPEKDYHQALLTKVTHKLTRLAGDGFMASVPIEHSPSPATDSVETQFRRLERQWKADTAHLSSSTKIMNHPALREIVAMGRAVVPLMLQDLRRGPSLWVWVLPEITGADPVAPADRGVIENMTRSWLSWADQNGYRP